MTRNWIVTASRTLWAADSNTAGRRRRGTSPRLENLECRLSLSGIAGNHIGMPAEPAMQGNLIGASAVVERKH
jgi:hypothetical protein